MSIFGKMPMILFRRHYSCFSAFIGLSVFSLSCKISNFSKDDSVSLAQNQMSDLELFCKTSTNYMGPSFKTEVDYICNQGKSVESSQWHSKAYDGTGDASRAIQQIYLKSNGDKTSFAFVGSLIVPKSLREIELIRRKSMEIGVFDTQWSVKVHYSVEKEYAPYKPKQSECYDLKEYTKDPFGESAVPIHSCFYSLGSKSLVSYQGLAPKANKDFSNRAVFVRIQLESKKTLVLVALTKDVDNRGLKDVAEGIVRGQAPELVTQFYRTLSQAPEAESLPKFVAETAEDINLTNVTEDWSWNRIKLSCKPQTGLFGLRQTPYTTLKPKALLQIDCGVNMSADAENTYRYEEASQKILPEAKLECRDDEYVAGVSYHRYSDKTHIIDGIKSLLCMKKKTKSESCTQRDEICSNGEFVRGIELKRIGGFICDGKRRDDDGTGCYRSDKVICCK